MLMSACPESDLSSASPLIYATHRHPDSVVRKKEPAVCSVQLHAHNLIFNKDPQLNSFMKWSTGQVHYSVAHCCVTITLHYLHAMGVLHLDNFAVFGYVLLVSIQKEHPKECELLLCVLFPSLISSLCVVFSNVWSDTGIMPFYFVVSEQQGANIVVKESFLCNQRTAQLAMFRQEGVKTEMLVLLLADSVVRVTGLLIWQVTWEPGERLQHRSALLITTIFIIPTKTDKEVQFLPSQLLFTKTTITVIHVNVVDFWLLT